jgi:hypothetical protein
MAIRCVGPLVKLGYVSLVDGLGNGLVLYTFSHNELPSTSIFFDNASYLANSSHHPIHW